MIQWHTDCLNNWLHHHYLLKNSTYKGTPSKASFFVFSVFRFMWRCKDCEIVLKRRSELLKHYKLNHRHYGLGHSYPCTYLHCTCRFKTWNALLSHLSRNHPAQQAINKAVSTFTCHICGHNQLSTEREFFQHIFNHLKNMETVTCVFQDCEYKTNVYENFKSHKY